MRIVVKNTFLVVENEDGENPKLNRSRSESSIASFSGSSDRQPLTISAGHVVYGDVESADSSSEFSADSGRRQLEEQSRSLRSKKPCKPTGLKLTQHKVSDHEVGTSAGSGEEGKPSTATSTQICSRSSDPVLVSEPQVQDAISLAELGQLPSPGSALHAEGQCRPCMLNHSKVGCKAGDSCQYCHFSHRGGKRPCKKKRERYLKYVDMMTAESTDKPCDTQEDAGSAKRDASDVCTPVGPQSEKPCKSTRDKSDKVTKPDRVVGSTSGSHGYQRGGFRTEKCKPNREKSNQVTNSDRAVGNSSGSEGSDRHQRCSLQSQKPCQPTGLKLTHVTSSSSQVSTLSESE